MPKADDELCVFTIHESLQSRYIAYLKRFRQRSSNFTRNNSVAILSGASYDEFCVACAFCKTMPTQRRTGDLVVFLAI